MTYKKLRKIEEAVLQVVWMEYVRNHSGKVCSQLDMLVCSTVEQTLNNLLDAEADQICRAQRYERSADRLDTRAGSYKSKLKMKAGQVVLKMPRLCTLPFETQIIECYKRRESSVEEALIGIGCLIPDENPFQLASLPVIKINVPIY